MTSCPAKTASIGPSARDSRSGVIAGAPLAEEGCRVAGCGHGGATVDASIMTKSPHGQQRKCFSVSLADRPCSVFIAAFRQPHQRP